MRDVATAPSGGSARARATVMGWMVGACAGTVRRGLLEIAARHRDESRERRTKPQRKAGGPNNSSPDAAGASERETVRERESVEHLPLFAQFARAPVESGRCSSAPARNTQSNVPSTRVFQCNRDSLRDRDSP